MAHKIVKMFTDEDGEVFEFPTWCLSIHKAGVDMRLCDGLVYGYGIGGAQVITKMVNKGAITCEDCLLEIKTIKSIKL